MDPIHPTRVTIKSPRAIWQPHVMIQTMATTATMSAMWFSRPHQNIFYTTSHMYFLGVIFTVTRKMPCFYFVKCHVFICQSLTASKPGVIDWEVFHHSLCLSSPATLTHMSDHPAQG